MTACAQTCGHTNRSVDFAGRIHHSGCRLTLPVTSPLALQCPVVLSDFAAVTIPELGLEIPSARRGRFTTLEGLLASVLQGLEAGQGLRRATDPAQAAQIDDFAPFKMSGAWGARALKAFRFDA